MTRNPTKRFKTSFYFDYDVTVFFLFLWMTDATESERTPGASYQDLGKRLARIVRLVQYPQCDDHLVMTTVAMDNPL